MSPDGAVTVLDEDEFAALELNEDDRAAADDALQQLIQLAESDLLPR